MSLYRINQYIVAEDGRRIITESGDLLVTEASPVTYELNIHGTDAVAPVEDLQEIGFPSGGWYAVLHSADQSPWLSGRPEIAAGQWLGGDIHAPISTAYPDSVGPFYLAEAGPTTPGRRSHIVNPEL